MWRNHRWISVILAVVVVFTLLSGCSKDSGVTTTVTSADGSFSIDLPGEWYRWIEEDEQTIWYNTKEDQIQVCVRRYSKLRADMGSFEECKEAVRTTWWNGAFSGDGVETSNIEIPNMTVKYQQQVEMTAPLSGEEMAQYFACVESADNYYIITYSADRMNYGTYLRSFQKALPSLREHTEVLTGQTIEASDTVRWFTAATAVLKGLDGANVYRFGTGMEEKPIAQEAAKQKLRDNWEIENRGTAKEAIETYMVQGDTTRLEMIYEAANLEQYATKEEAMKADIAFFERVGMGDSEKEALLSAFYEGRSKFGKDLLRGWDFVTAMYLCELAYTAGYYTETDALDQALSLAKELQNTYTSWEEVMESVSYGMQVRMLPERQQERAVEDYETLKAWENSPYAIDWNTPLEKTW